MVLGACTRGQLRHVPGGHMPMLPQRQALRERPRISNRALH